MDRKRERGGSIHKNKRIKRSKEIKKQTERMKEPNKY
jgi:hypothetical protein